MSRNRSGLTTAREPRNETLTYPGGLRARWRWGGSGEGAAVFALSEAGGSLHENGATVATDYEALCRAELRLEGPRGAWTARFASTIYDDPRALHWDNEGLLVVAYGPVCIALAQPLAETQRETDRAYVRWLEERSMLLQAAEQVSDQFHALSFSAAKRGTDLAQL